MGAAPFTPVRGPRGGLEGYERGADGALLVVGSKGQREGVPGIVRALGDPLDFYLHRRMISEDEFSAGDTLRRDHFAAFGSGYHAVNLDGFHGVSNAADNWRFSPFKSDRMKSFIAATDALPKKVAKLVELVVVRGVYANEAARQIGEPPRKGFQVLKDGLAALATFYRRGMSAGPGSNRGRDPGQVGRSRTDRAP